MEENSHHGNPMNACYAVATCCFIKTSMEEPRYVIRQTERMIARLLTKLSLFCQKSSKQNAPVGSFDLETCTIEPAGKHDTKRKHTILITTPNTITLYIQLPSEKELSSWLDGVMRDLISRKEGVYDVRSE